MSLSLFSPSLNLSTGVNAKLTVSSKRLPCPVCTKTNGNCRIAEDKVLCMTFPDGETHPLFRWVRRSSNDLWGVFVPQAESAVDRAAWQRRQDTQRRYSPPPPQRRPGLTPAERHRAITNILAQLTLGDDDRAYLEGRDTPVAVITYCRSVQKFQPLEPAVHPDLAGVNRYGTALNNGWSGILVPFADANDYFVGLRLHDPHHRRTGHPKYVWLSSGSRGIGPHLPNGELPLAVHYPPVISDPTRIGLCEGVEWKAAAAAQRLGYPVIGFSGFNFRQSPECLQQALTTIQQHLGLPSITVTLIPDAGVACNNTIATSHHHTLDWLISLDYEVSVAWWGQFTKEVGDIDEISPADIAHLQYLTPLQFRQLCPGKPAKLDDFKQWLGEQLRRVKPRGFALSPQGDPFSHPRAQAWLQALEHHPYVLDASDAGDGKSHAVLQLENPQGRIIYIAQDHRNPSIPALADKFTDLMPRSQYGFYRQEGRLVQATADTPKSLIEVEGNCIRASWFEDLGNLGYDPYDTDGKNPICRSCPLFQACGHRPGLFRYERQQALQQPYLRAHLDSLPRDGDYRKDLLIHEEPSQTQPTRTITTYWHQLLLEADRLRPTLSPEQWFHLDTYLQALRPLFDTTQGFGLDHPTILSSLKKTLTSLPDSSLQNLITALENRPLDLHQIFPPVDHLCFQNDNPDAFAGLSTSEKRHLGQRLRDANAFYYTETFHHSHDNLRQLPPNALLSLLKALRGDRGIALRLQGRSLTLTLDRRSDYAFIHTAKGNLFLDATLSADRLQILMGLPSLKVLRRQTTPPLSNLTLMQIQTEGWGSSHPSDTAIERARLLYQALQSQYGDMPRLGYKSLLNVLDLDGYWFRDNRGSNAFAGCPAMFTLGLPYPNVGALQDEYLALQGSLDGFDDHYQRRISEEILQNLGRQRANRFPDRSFTHFFITPHHYDCSWLQGYGAKVITVDALEITPEAGSNTQAARWRLLETIYRTGKTGKTAIAKALGITRQAIDSLLHNAGVTLDSLVQSLAPLWDKSTTSPPSRSYTRPACRNSVLVEHFRWFFDLGPLQLLQDSLNMIQAGGWETYQREILPYLPLGFQGQLLGYLWALVADPPPLSPSYQLFWSAESIPSYR